MAQNVASKYSKKVDERFKLASLARAATNQAYNWTGVKTVQVYSVDTVAMGDYTRSGTSRYGTPGELGTALQELTLSRDRAFTFTIDRGNYTEEQMVTESGRALRRQIDEVVIPEIDVYILAALATAADGNGHTAATTAATSASNAFSIVTELNELLDDDKVPTAGRMLFVNSTAYKFLKRDTSFILASELGQKVKFTGQIGEVDGLPVVRVPGSYMPANTDMILTHPMACVAPMKIEDYKVHNNPPGINGWLVEGRLIYGAFVLNNKLNAIAIHTTSPSS